MSGTASDRGVDISISHSPTCTAQLENQRISRTNSTTHAKQSSRSLRNTSHARARTILNGACSSGASRVWAAQVDAEGEAGVGRGQEEVRVEKEEEGSLQDRRWRNLLVCSNGAQHAMLFVLAVRIFTPLSRRQVPHIRR